MNDALPKQLSHGNILAVVDDIFYVQGENVIIHDGTRLQSSRTMTIVRDNADLSLINSIRLDDDGIKNLQELGQIKNVVRLGAFHGRDDAFYQIIKNVFKQSSGHLKKWILFTVRKLILI